jgi:O-antigen ligase
VSFFLHGHLRGTLRWVLFLFGYFITAKTVAGLSAQTFAKNVSRLLAVSGSLIGGLAMIQYFSHRCDYTRVVGTFKQHNSTAMFLSLCLPMTVYAAWVDRDKSVVVRRAVLFLCIGGILVSYSRGAWMGLAVGSAILFGHRVIQRRFSLHDYAAVMALLLVSFFALGHARHGLTGRNWYWKAGWNIIKTHPWCGLGPGNYASQIKSYLTGASLELYNLELEYYHDVRFWIHLHNLYLQYLVEYGFLGGGLFFWALGQMVRKAFHSTLTWIGIACQVSIIGFLVHNLVDILSVNSFDILFGILIALAGTPPAPPDNPAL